MSKVMMAMPASMQNMVTEKPKLGTEYKTRLIGEKLNVHVRKRLQRQSR